MFQELLDKSYTYFDGSTCPAAEMNESERTDILNALSIYYEMSEVSSEDLEQLETILIILFNYSEHRQIRSFRSVKANELFKEIESEFLKRL